VAIDEDGVGGRSNRPHGHEEAGEPQRNSAARRAELYE
jgi:hypothetical protein